MRRRDRREAFAFLFLLLPFFWGGCAKPGAAPEGTIVIRIAHWQLESGLRESIDRIAAAYMKLHPEVRVVQIPIPERIYPTWFVTQLVGGTAPEIVEIGYGMSEERLARFFRPLSDLAEAPNPYNRGTPLEGVPLRETLVDGMNGGYNPALLDYYSVPTSAYTIRLFANLDLLEKVTGSREMPRTFSGLLALCRATAAYAKRTGLPVVPLAGSKFNAPILMRTLFGSQTQSLLAELNPPGRYDIDGARLGNQYARGAWGLDRPELQAGFGLVRELGRYTQPGFMQLQRDDATLCFVQGNALMICTGSWDARSIRGEADFPVGVVPIPFPESGDPDYGRFTRGSLTEAGQDAAVAFGLTREVAHPEAARDFLLFLASQPMNQLFTDISGWLPDVIGVRLPSDAEPFRPVVEGTLPGFSPPAFGADTERVYENALYRLFAPDGAPRAFAASLKEEYGRALRDDLRRSGEAGRDNVERLDTLLGAAAWRAAARPDDAASATRLDRALAAAAANETAYHAIRAATRALEAAQP